MYIFFSQNKLVKPWLKIIYSNISKDRKTEFDASINFDDNIQVLNKEYRGKDSSTDVLSFNVEDPSNPKYIGDLVFSVKDIAANAKQFDQTFHDELTRCIVHGTLHLMGFDHVGHLDHKKPLEEMFIIQENLLTKILNGNTLQKIQESDI
jgi:probable rRNA maturation factor